jgi:thiol-disulfide isomerase/thioredoxin
MPVFKKLIMVMMAAAALVAAAVIVFQVGLPQRGDYTGQIVEGIGVVAPEVGFTAPLISQNMLNGEPRRLTDLRGEWVIVNFWATWCGPCRDEMPELQQLHEEGWAVLGVNLGEPVASVARWVDEMGLEFDILLDLDGQATVDYRVGVQPMTFVISPQGIIRHIFYGQTTADAIRAVIPS